MKGQRSTSSQSVKYVPGLESENKMSFPPPAVKMKKRIIGNLTSRALLDNMTSVGLLEESWESWGSQILIKTHSFICTYSILLQVSGSWAFPRFLCEVVASVTGRMKRNPGVGSIFLMHLLSLCFIFISLNVGFCQQGAATYVTYMTLAFQCKVCFKI